MDPNQLLMLQQMNQGAPQASANPSNPAAVNSSNPFDEGIRKAIDSARESLGMTHKQQEKALRSSILTFANNMSQQPRESGFLNNFAAVGRALNPAISDYDNQESGALNENNQLANQILKYRMDEQARQDALEQRNWQRKHAEAQLGETRKQHNLLNNFRPPSSEDGELNRMLSTAEALVTASGNKGTRSRTQQLAAKYLPGGYLKNEEQSEIDTIGDIIRGKLFNSWGYKNQAEFEHVPSISSSNTPEANKAILKQLKGLLTNSPSDQQLMMSPMTQEASEEAPDSEYIIMRNPANGEEMEVHISDINRGLNQGLERVN